MIAGDLTGFCEFFETNKCVDTCIGWTGSGMVNPLPLLKHLRTCTVRTTPPTAWQFDPVVAKPNLDMWQLLTNDNPDLHPVNWYNGDLKSSPDDRLVVCDDGVKLKHNKPYKPTKLHYDGQLGNNEEGARRIQAAYCDDKGAIRLFVTPGTHLPEVRQLITSITGAEYSDGFTGFGDFPELTKLLMKYSVALPSTGLLMWRANVAHFEGVALPTEEIRLLHASSRNWTQSSFSAETRAASIFRIYCGVISVPLDGEGKMLSDMKTMAFLRQKGFGMIPTHHPNRAHVLFVNDKGFQGASRIGKDGVGASWLAANNKMFAKVFGEASHEEINTTLKG